MPGLIPTPFTCRIRRSWAPSSGATSNSARKATASAKSANAKLVQPADDQDHLRRPLINENEAGICGHFLSLGLGSVDNTHRFQYDPDRLAVALPKIYALPPSATRRLQRHRPSSGRVPGRPLRLPAILHHPPATLVQPRPRRPRPPLPQELSRERKKSLDIPHVRQLRDLHQTHPPPARHRQPPNRSRSKKSPNRGRAALNLRTMSKVRPWRGPGRHRRFFDSHFVILAHEHRRCSKWRYHPRRSGFWNVNSLSI